MKYPELIKQLTSIMDSEGLTAVLAALECICHDNAILINDKRWSESSKVLYDAAHKIQKIGV